MKITIDTNTDSKEDIRAAIRLLQNLVEHPTLQNEPQFPSGENVFGNILDQATDTKTDDDKEEFSLSKLQTY